MTTESATKPQRGTGAAKRRGRAKYVVLLAVALAIFLAAQTGFLGYGLAHLRAATFPRDEALLAYVPGGASAVAILDPHQIRLKELGAEGGTVRQFIDRTRDDLKKATGVDVAFDVDKLVLSPSLVVARGRFNEHKLAERLADHSYVPAEYKGVKYLLRAGEDAIAVIDGSILLYGVEAQLRAGIDAESAGTSLAKRDEVTSRLAQVGWNHPILALALLVESKPSLRAILSGSTGPRAVTVGISLKDGASLLTVIEAASPTAADELLKLLNEKRADPEPLKAIAGPEAGPVLADLAKRASLAVEPGSSRLAIRLDVHQPEIEVLAKASEKMSMTLGEMYKNARLLQLLTPVP